MCRKTTSNSPNELVITPRRHCHYGAETLSFCRRDIVILPQRHRHSAAETLSFCRRERVRMEQRYSEDYPDCQRGRSKGTVRSVRTHKDSFESMLLSHESLFSGDENVFVKKSEWNDEGDGVYSIDFTVKEKGTVAFCMKKHGEARWDSLIEYAAKR